MRSPIVKTNTANISRLLTNGIALTPFHLGPSIITTTTDPTDYSTFGNASSLILNYNTTANNGRIYVSDADQLWSPPTVAQAGYEGVWRELFNSDNASCTKSTAATLTAQNTNFAIGFNANTSLFPAGSLVNTGVSILDIDANPYDNAFYFLTPYDGAFYISSTLSHSGLATVNDFKIELWKNGAFWQGGISRFDSFGQVKVVSVEGVFLFAANDIIQIVCKYTGPATLALATNQLFNRLYIKAFTKGIVP